jgi:Family of unknown function (DUF6152)
MKITKKITVLACGAVVALLVVVPRPTLAHHGAAAYDLSRSTTLEGTVTSLDWSNPHCLLHFDAKNEQGEVQHWTIELYNPLWLTRAGWKRTSLKAGDPITITFHATKSGAPNGYIRDGDGKLTFNGKEFSFHQAGDDRGPGER